MTSLDALKRTQQFRMSGDFGLDRLRNMWEEDEIAKGDAAMKAEMARLENRKIMRGEMAKREEARNRPAGTPSLDWKPGIPSDMLTREQDP